MPGVEWVSDKETDLQNLPKESQSVSGPGPS